MAYKEYHIDGRYGLFGKFYFANKSTGNYNPFSGVQRTAMQAATGNADAQSVLAKFNELDALGINAEDLQGNKFIPLKAHLVVPDREEGAPFPLAIFIHGQSSTYKKSGGKTKETKSYRGYRYLQKYLGDKGIASVSINVNVAGTMEPYNPTIDSFHRIEIALLIMVFLKQLVNGSISENQPVFVKKRDDSIQGLNEVLNLTEGLTTGSPERLITDLKDKISGKISFTNLGFMGHSRGADSVSLIQPFFSPRLGTKPVNPDTIGAITLPASDAILTRMEVRIGEFNRHTVVHGFSVLFNPFLYHYMMDLMVMLGSPSMANVKAIVSLEPAGNDAILDSPTTFYLVIAGSHDPDVSEESFNEYENVNAPKAMVFSHGSNHARFNQVWRRLKNLRRQANRQILCQSPIRMLSNRGHENLAKATVANALLATQLGESHRFAFFTGELKAPGLGQDISRAWFFPFPFTATPNIRSLDGAAITASNVTQGTEVKPEIVYILSMREVNSEKVFANQAKMKAWIRPASDTMVIRIPIASTDRLVTRTHISFRYTKEYDAQSRRSRRNIDFRNYTLRLKSASGTIGTLVNGVDVPSLHHKAYPTMDYSGTCEEATKIIMQTAEVPLKQFLDPGGHPLSDLSQVTSLEIKLNARSGASGNETFFFVDYLLTSRKFPQTPTDFSIP